jgi:hypothetical protein
MEWILSNQDCAEETIKDTQSGFAITLLAGSWIEPFNLDIKTPKGMGFQWHALYLRSGLGVAKELMTKRLT